MYSYHGINTLTQNSITALNTLTHGHTFAAEDVCRQTQWTTPLIGIKDLFTIIPYYLFLNFMSKVLYQIETLSKSIYLVQIIIWGFIHR